MRIDVQGWDFWYIAKRLFLSAWRVSKPLITYHLRPFTLGAALPCFRDFGENARDSIRHFSFRFGLNV
jgi:hypothetical protein